MSKLPEFGDLKVSQLGEYFRQNKITRIPHNLQNWYYKKYFAKGSGRPVVHWFILMAGIGTYFHRLNHGNHTMREFH